MKRSVPLPSRWARVAIYAGPVLISALLSACGGGADVPAVDGAASVNKGPANVIVTDAATGTVTFSSGPTPNGEITSSVPLTAEDYKFWTASAADVESFPLQGESDKRILADAKIAAVVSNPTPCRTYRFSGVQGCLQTGTALTQYPDGSSPASIPGAVAGCTEVTVGSTYSATTPPPGGKACFQYVINSSTTVSSQVRLPNSITAATVELFAVASNLAGYKLALAQSPDKPLNVSATNAYVRHVLMVRAADGPGGEAFNIGIGVPAIALPGALNDQPTRPDVVAMNQTVVGTIETTGQSDFYYFYPTTPGQTTAQFVPVFTANQTLTWRKASRSSSGVYTSMAETVVAAGASGQMQTLSALTATAAGATTTNGVMIRVSKKAPFATTAQSFSARVGVRTGYLTNYGVWNYEGLAGC